MKIALLPGDGIGPDIRTGALQARRSAPASKSAWFEGDVAARATSATYTTKSPPETLQMAKAADALFGAAILIVTRLSGICGPNQRSLGREMNWGCSPPCAPPRLRGFLKMSGPPEAAAAIDPLIVREPMVTCTSVPRHSALPKTVT
jgi:isocitrate/isopropylmalate dehydrogenase